MIKKLIVCIVVLIGSHNQAFAFGACDPINIRGLDYFLKNLTINEFTMSDLHNLSNNGKESSSFWAMQHQEVSQAMFCAPFKSNTDENPSFGEVCR